MRLFVAVELGDEIMAAAGRASAELSRRLGASLRARWVPTSNLHLTVRYIGHVADERVPPLLAALRPSLSFPAFEIALGECGMFPPHGPPRVLWIGVKEGLPLLQAMHAELNRRLLPLGFAAEDRPYSAHLTLARVKDAPRGASRIAREAVRTVSIPEARSRVVEATLFESRLSPAGPTYTSLIRIPLRP